jgi:hypothetical protein
MMKKRRISMRRFKLVSLAVGLLLAAGVSFGQEKKPLSPAGTAATQVGGEWTKDSEGEMRHSGGKWIEVTYSRPILRGRENVFGSGADYGKAVSGGAPVWRVGANATTKLKTEVPLEIAGKKVAAGEYDVFVDLKESGWTLILSTQPTQTKYDPKDKTAIWGSYGYDTKYDVVRAPMQMTKLQHSVDQFTIAFVDMTDKGGRLALAWGKDAALVEFSVAQ